MHVRGERKPGGEKAWNTGEETLEEQHVCQIRVRKEQARRNRRADKH